MGYAGNQPQYGTFPSDLFTGNGSNTVFTMSSVPGNDAALLVTVDGVRQHTDTYSFTANTLTFSEAPGSGAIIETVNMGSRADIIITEGVYKKTQFTATASQTNFTIPTGYTVGFVDVYLNGIRLVVADDFTATDGSTIILATAAASGDSVEVVAYGTFNVANALLKSGDTMSGNLVVSGTSTLMSPVAIANTTGNTVVFAANGNVGIGYAAANTKLSFGNYIPSNGQTLHIFQSGNTVSGLGVVSGIYRVFTSDGASMSFGHVNTTDGTTFLERMRVDASGRVTKPYQPVFHIQKSDGSQAHANVISFNSALTNVGGHYSTSTNRFTAPIAGTYHFYSNILDDGAISGHAGVRFGLRKNGTFIQKSQNFYGRTDSTYNFTHVELTITLASSDYIDVCNDGGSSSIYGGEGVFGCFGGWLIG